MGVACFELPSLATNSVGALPASPGRSTPSSARRLLLLPHGSSAATRGSAICDAADIAEDSPRLCYALECWTALNRAATRRWLHGKATRETTHELLASHARASRAG
jgi:hypothetical protein